MVNNLTERKVSLSERELEIINLVKQGLSNPVIAEELGISVKTVENHVRSILNKLGAKNRTDAMVIALRNGMIDI